MFLNRLDLDDIHGRPCNFSRSYFLARNRFRSQYITSILFGILWIQPLTYSALLVVDVCKRPTIAYLEHINISNVRLVNECSRA